MYDSVPMNPNIWAFSAGAPSEETMERFWALTRMGRVNWLIVIVNVPAFEHMPPEGGYAVGLAEE